MAFFRRQAEDIERRSSRPNVVQSDFRRRHGEGWREFRLAPGVCNAYGLSFYVDNVAMAKYSKEVRFVLETMTNLNAC